MTIRADQLPAHIRKRYNLDAPKPARARAGVGMGAPCPGRCAGCGQPFAKYTEFEKHSSPGHRRWIIDL